VVQCPQRAPQVAEGLVARRRGRGVARKTFKNVFSLGEPAISARGVVDTESALVEAPQVAEGLVARRRGRGVARKTFKIVFSVGGPASSAVRIVDTKSALVE
jgi:predicted GNAT superfamily acetyltransferase